MNSGVPSVKLNSGYSIPVFGLGTWKSQPGVVKQAVMDAIDVGYRHFDCALAYGNESEVGAAIHEKIKEGVIQREDLFITSKLWNTFHSMENVKKGLRKSLALLNFDYLDLYLIHWPFGYQEGGDLFPKNDKGEIILSNIDYVETWKEMEECVKLGLTKSIGVANFNTEQIERILEICVIRPAVNQIECHPYLNQKRLIDFCKKRDILVTAYSPLGSPDRPWAKPNDPRLLDDPKLVELAKKYNKTPAQLVLRWEIQRNLVVIPKTVHKERLIENINIFDFALAEGDMEYIDSLNCNGRLLTLEWAKKSPYYPFTIEY